MFLFLFCLDGQLMEQVTAFMRLGIIFQTSGAWTVQLECVIEKASQNIKILTQCSHTNGHSFVPSVLNVSKAKPLPQLLYEPM